MKAIEIYTDGACSGNPGPGGWGVVLLYQGNKKELSGYQPETTNNRMELFAAIQGLAALRSPARSRCIPIPAISSTPLKSTGWTTGSATAGRPAPNRPWKIRTSGSCCCCTSRTTACASSRSRGTATMPTTTAATRWPSQPSATDAPEALGRRRIISSQKTTFAKRWTPQEREGRNFGRSILS